MADSSYSFILEAMDPVKVIEQKPRAQSTQSRQQHQRLAPLWLYREPEQEAVQ